MEANKKVLVLILVSTLVVPLVLGLAARIDGLAWLGEVVENQVLALSFVTTVIVLIREMRP